MRKNYQMWLLGALVGGLVLPFAGCSNEDDPTPVGPGSGETVKTQFAINIPYAKKAETKMSADNTQNNNNNFLGMYDIRLLPMTGEAPTLTNFSSIIGLGSIGNTEITDGTTNSKVYADVNIPVGTTHFLFYGVGGTDAPASDEERFAEGILNSTFSSSSINGISFSLRGAQITNGSENETLISVLNRVAQVANWSDQSDGTTLGDLYDNFITLKAGSAKSICEALEDLYNSVDALAKEATESTEKTIAAAIQSAITYNSYFTLTGGDYPYTLTTTLTYPRNINMPDGAAILSYDTKNKTFSYNTKDPSISSQGIKMADICFPASLYYFVNTDLKANNTIPDTWPATLTDWSSGFTSWGTSVTTSTRAIALTDPVQYGVAGLKVSVKCESSLMDDSRGNQISVPSDGFTVTGVLVGGQPSQAGYDLCPAASTSFNKIVYDKTMNGTVAAKGGSAEGVNYTLVLDNKQGTAAKVPIIVELENTAVGFYGKDEQYVPNGTKFYLVAELDPANKTVTNVTNPWVFMQDYLTTANLTITSLKNAENTIPDLVSSTLELGLAVDLDWQSGISFDVTIP